MWKYTLLLLILAAAGCNLNMSSSAGESTYTPRPTEDTQATSPSPTPTGLVLPTPLNLPGVGITQVGVTDVEVTSAPDLGTRCQVYMTYSGVGADNKLSLRAQPATSADQLFRVSNNAQVLLVPGTQEIEGEGYHWLNVIYIHNSIRYMGWIARDSFAKNGVRDPSIPTLIPTTSQADC